MQEADQASSDALPTFGIRTTDAGKNIFQFPKNATTTPTTIQNNNRDKHDDDESTNSESDPPKFSSQQQIFFDLLSSSSENVNPAFSQYQKLALSGFTNPRESSSSALTTEQNQNKNKLLSATRKKGKTATPSSSSNSEKNNKNGHHHSSLYRVEFLNEKTDLLKCEVKDVLIFGKNNRQVAGYLKKQAFVKLRKELEKKENESNHSNDNDENIPQHQNKRDELKSQNGKKKWPVNNPQEISSSSGSLSSTLCSNRNWFEHFPQQQQQHHEKFRRQREEDEIIFCTLENYEHRSTEPSSTNVVARRAKLFGKPGKQFELCQNGFAASPAAVSVVANDDDADQVDQRNLQYYPRVLSKLYDDMVIQMDHFCIPRNHNLENRILRKFLLAQNEKMNNERKDETQQKDDDLDLLLSIVESFEVDAENNSNGDIDDGKESIAASDDHQTSNQDGEEKTNLFDNKCIRDIIGKLARDPCLYSILQVVLRCASGSTSSIPTLKIVTMLPATVYDALGDGFYDDLPEWDMMIAEDINNNKKSNCSALVDAKATNNTNKISDREEPCIPWFEDSRARLLEHFFAAEKQQLGNTDATAVTLAKNNPYVVFGDDASGKGDHEDSDESSNKRNETLLNFEQVVNEQDIENYFKLFYGDEIAQSSQDEEDDEDHDSSRNKKKITSKKSKQNEKKTENQLGTFNPIFVQKRSNEHSLDVVVEVSHNDASGNYSSFEVRVPLDNFRIAFPELVMDFLLEHTMLLPTTNYGMEHLLTPISSNNKKK